MQRYLFSTAAYGNSIPRPFFTWRGAATSGVRFLEGHFFNIFLKREVKTDKG